MQIKKSIKHIKIRLNTCFTLNISKILYINKNIEIIVKGIFMTYLKKMFNKRFGANKIVLKKIIVFSGENIITALGFFLC
jgi:hypothetical protein